MPNLLGTLGLRPLGTKTPRRAGEPQNLTDLHEDAEVDDALRLVELQQQLDTMSDPAGASGEDLAALAAARRSAQAALSARDTGMAIDDIRAMAALHADLVSTIKARAMASPLPAASEATRKAVTGLTRKLLAKKDANAAGGFDAAVEVLRELSLAEAERSLVDMLDSESKRELLLLYKDGQLKAATIGQAKKEYDPKASAPMPDGESAADCVLTHSHPDGSPLSAGDVRVAVDRNVLAIRATGRNGTFSLMRPGASWGKLDQAQILEAYSRAGPQAWAAKADGFVAENPPAKKAGQKPKSATLDDIPLRRQATAEPLPAFRRKANAQASSSTADKAATQAEPKESSASPARGLRPSEVGKNKTGETFAEDLCMGEHFACVELAAKFGLVYSHPGTKEIGIGRMALYEARDAQGADKRAGFGSDMIVGRMGKGSQDV